MPERLLCSLIGVRTGRSSVCDTRMRVTDIRVNPFLCASLMRDRRTRCLLIDGWPYVPAGIEKFDWARNDGPAVEVAEESEGLAVVDAHVRTRYREGRHVRYLRVHAYINVSWHRQRTTRLLFKLAGSASTRVRACPNLGSKQGEQRGSKRSKLPVRP